MSVRELLRLICESQSRSCQYPIETEIKYESFMLIFIYKKPSKVNLFIRWEFFRVQIHVEIGDSKGSNGRICDHILRSYAIISCLNRSNPTFPQAPARSKIESIFSTKGLALLNFTFLIDYWISFFNYMEIDVAVAKVICF